MPLYPTTEAEIQNNTDGLDALDRKNRAQVLRCTGIPVGVGIAGTKTLAKLANDTAKRLQAQTGAW